MRPSPRWLRRSPPAALEVRSINADIGDLNRPVNEAERAERDAHLERLVDLAVRTSSPAIVLPCGAQSAEPIVDLETDIALVASELRRRTEALIVKAEEPATA